MTDRAHFGPLAAQEAAVRTFKARRVYRCALCNGTVLRGQQVTVTTGLRWTHTGCFIDARAERDGQGMLPFPPSGG